MLNMQELEKVIKNLSDAAKRNNEYILITPDLNLYKGSARQIFSVVSKDALREFEALPPVNLPSIGRAK